jgi:hypothetical protein
MDLQLFGRVVWRFRLLVAVGTLIAIFLATLSLCKITPQGLTYRGSEEWVSYSRVLVTESGFPEGKLSLSGGADPTRFIQLAIIYSNFTNTDSVARRLARPTPLPGSVEAAAVPVTPGSTDVLPIISIAGISDSRAHSNELTTRATTALIDYVHQQQRVHDIAEKDLVQLQVIQKPGLPKMLKGRSKTMPIVVFMGVMSVIVGLAFAFENARPRARAVADAPQSRASKIA